MTTVIYSQLDFSDLRIQSEEADTGGAPAPLVHELLPGAPSPPFIVVWGDATQTLVEGAVFRVMGLPVRLQRERGGVAMVISERLLNAKQGVARVARA